MSAWELAPPIWSLGIFGSQLSLLYSEASGISMVHIHFLRKLSIILNSRRLLLPPPSEENQTWLVYCGSGASHPKEA